MIMDQTIYKEYILDLFRNPLNKGVLPMFDISHRDFNTSCGDDVTIYIQFEDGVIKAVGHEGVGCAISQAATSLITNHVKGKAPEAVLQMTDEDMMTLLGVFVSYTRRKCALLGFETIRKAIQKSAN